MIGVGSSYLTCVDVATYTYDPYGHGNTATGNDAAQNLIRYTGGLQDTSSNYLHLGSRWYNPVTDAFTTQDTNTYLDDPANGNRYAAANPANNTDPTGACSLLDCIDTYVSAVQSVGRFFSGNCQSGLYAGAATVFATSGAEVGVHATSLALGEEAGPALETALTVVGGGIAFSSAAIVISGLILTC